jgi:hypothetical protein
MGQDVKIIDSARLAACLKTHHDNYMVFEEKRWTSGSSHLFSAFGALLVFGLYMITISIFPFLRHDK